jgi:hypothetical protein
MLELRRMEARLSPSVRIFIPASVFLVGSGALGLYWVFMKTEPNGGTRWAFFFLSILLLTGLALPVMAYFNLRFPTNPPAGVGVVVRQSILFGLYFPVLAWLQVGRVLALPMAVLLAAGLVFIEVLFRLRERSQWKP